MSDNFIQSHTIINCFNSSFIAANEDIFNGDPASDVISLANARECTFVVQKGAGATGTATITVQSCDDVTPTTGTAVPFRYRACTSGDTFGNWTAATASGFTTTAGANQVYEINIQSDELYYNSTTNLRDQFVRLICTEVADSPCDGGGIAILTGLRYGGDTPATALA